MKVPNNMLIIFENKIHLQPGAEHSDCSHGCVVLPICISASVLRIKENGFFFYTLIQNILCGKIKINDFRGDLTDISARKEALI